MKLQWRIQGGGVALAIDFNDSSMYIIAQAGKIILFIRNK